MTSTGKPASTAGWMTPLPEPTGEPDHRSGTVTSTGAEERIVVAALPAEVFAAVADVRRMARWSPSTGPTNEPAAQAY
ncbi:MAG: hypothetical protein ACRDS0_18225 [Pseudonocardiaceae bacterium]